jgi:hypothetical protein
MPGSTMMSLDHPAYWLPYVPEGTETGTPVITAVAPEVLPRSGSASMPAVCSPLPPSSPPPRPARRVRGAVTRWLHSKGLE